MVKGWESRERLISASHETENLIFVSTYLSISLIGIWIKDFSISFDVGRISRCIIVIEWWRIVSPWRLSQKRCIFVAWTFCCRYRWYVKGTLTMKNIEILLAITLIWCWFFFLSLNKNNLLLWMMKNEWLKFKLKFFNDETRCAVAGISRENHNK
jgi:hypothetical protein